MYKHILIATDGSELAGKAVTAGLELAKSLNARTTAVIVSEPWSATVTDGHPAFMFPTRDYDKAVEERARQILSTVGSAANKTGVACETLHVNGFPAECHRRDSTGEGVRPDRHGVTRTARSNQAIARQSNNQSAVPRDHTGARLPLTARVIHDHPATAFAGGSPSRGSHRHACS